MIKKISVFTLILIMTLTMCSCSKNEKQATTKTPTPVAVDDPIEEKTKVEQMQDAGEFDEVLCSGDEYYIVKKTEDNYDGYRVLVGVINSDGDWLYNLSTSNIFARAIFDVSQEKTLSGSKIELTSDNFEYMGDGIFIASLGVEINGPSWSKKLGTYSTIRSTGLDCYFFNVKENVQTSFEATNITPYDNGYMLMYNSDRYNDNFYNVNTRGEITKLPCEYDSTLGRLSFPGYSDGVFFAEKKFFDINGNVVLDLSEYDLYGKKYGEFTFAPYFENGKCKIKFRNNGGTLYEAVIDKQGNFIEEPKKLDY